jgi:hypothetical protein
LPEKLEGKHSLILSGFFKNSSIFLKFSLMGGLWRFIFLFYRVLGLRFELVCSERMGSGKAFLSFQILSAAFKGLSSVVVLLRMDMLSNQAACFIININ